MTAGHLRTLPTAPVLAVLELAALRITAQNVRTNAEADLDGLAASMTCEREPYLVQPPTVEATGPGVYRILLGERRVRGALLAGWTTIACLVLPPPDPLAEITMRLVENLHRRDLDPLDAATALKVAWLAENAAALGGADEVRAALDQESPPQQTLATLRAVADANGFTPTRPVVPWATLLGRLGLAVGRERLKKLLRVLNLAPDVLDTVRPLRLSEAGLRALGTLEPPEQRLVAAELADDPSLARKLRRVARLVRQGGYPVEQALAEVRGEVYQGPGEQTTAPENVYQQHAPDIDSELTGPDESPVGPDYADAVLRLVELAEQFAAARAHLFTTTGSTRPEALPHPYGALVAEALALIRSD